jgi:DNA-binding NarL/FixJ family response regulator
VPLLPPPLIRAPARPHVQPRLRTSSTTASVAAVPSEQEVPRLVARGRSNAEIAAELVLSEHTAKTHVTSILQKLELRTASRQLSSPTRPVSSGPATQNDP